MQCGRADHDSCEIIDELQLTINNLREEKKEVKDDLMKDIRKLEERIRDLECDIDDINLGGSL